MRGHIQTARVAPVSTRSMADIPCGCDVDTARQIMAFGRVYCNLYHRRHAFAQRVADRLEQSHEYVAVASSRTHHLRSPYFGIAHNSGEVVG
mmetsp:Transcript_67300/g.132750  ORF Transcript_67300/g.132750 Transcript_67300/m.132750 type:complete len:92 (+) Transcript_67300:163-438(+)